MSTLLLLNRFAFSHSRTVTSFHTKLLVLFLSFYNRAATAIEERAFIIMYLEVQSEAAVAAAAL